MQVGNWASRKPAGVNRHSPRATTARNSVWPTAQHVPACSAIPCSKKSKATFHRERCCAAHAVRQPEQRAHDNCTRSLQTNPAVRDAANVEIEMPSLGAVAPKSIGVKIFAHAEHQAKRHEHKRRTSAKIAAASFGSRVDSLAHGLGWPGFFFFSKISLTASMWWRTMLRGAECRAGVDNDWEHSCRHSQELCLSNEEPLRRAPRYEHGGDEVLLGRIRERVCEWCLLRSLLHAEVCCDLLKVLVRDIRSEGGMNPGVGLDKGHEVLNMFDRICVGLPWCCTTCLVLWDLRSKAAEHQITRTCNEQRSAHCSHTNGSRLAHQDAHHSALTPSPSQIK